MSLRTGLKALLRPNVRLANFCTMQVGGPAKYFAEPSAEEEFCDLLEFSQQENIPFFILGKGSNVIFPDEGFPGLVITTIHYEQDKIEFDDDKLQVKASAGIHLYRLVLACRDHGFGGAEFLANIPGTVGGAILMNGGFSRFPGQKNEIGDLVEEVTVMNPDGKKEILTRRELEFSYRRSNLQGKIILSGTLQLWRRKSEDIQKEIRANFDYRNSKQDLRYPSSGSIFKNPPHPNPLPLRGRGEKLSENFLTSLSPLWGKGGVRGPFLSAGQIIDALGLKGLRVGDAMVSEKHGNYFINLGGAKSSDLIELIHKVQKLVLDATGIILEPEVRIIEKP